MNLQSVNEEEGMDDFPIIFQVSFPFFNLYFSRHSIEQKPVFLKNFLASLLWILGGSPQNLHFIFYHLSQDLRSPKRIFKEIR